MPELPEVETTRRGIARHLRGKRINDAVVRERQLREAAANPEAPGQSSAAAVEAATAFAGKQPGDLRRARLYLRHPCDCGGVMEASPVCFGQNYPKVDQVCLQWVSSQSVSAQGNAGNEQCSPAMACRGDRPVARTSPFENDQNSPLEGESARQGRGLRPSLEELLDPAGCQWHSDPQGARPQSRRWGENEVSDTATSARCSGNPPPHQPAPCGLACATGQSCVRCQSFCTNRHLTAWLLRLPLKGGVLFIVDAGSFKGGVFNAAPMDWPGSVPPAPAPTPALAMSSYGRAPILEMALVFRQAPRPAGFSRRNMPPGAAG